MNTRPSLYVIVFFCFFSPLLRDTEKPGRRREKKEPKTQLSGFDTSGSVLDVVDMKMTAVVADLTFV